MTQLAIDELILRFSRRSPRNGNESLITLPTTSPYQAVDLEPPGRYSEGTLGRLPIEIFDHIFTYLDVQSLSRLASASHYYRDVVRSFPQFERLLGSLYPTLAGMSQMHALSWYSCSELISIALSESCASCGDYAPYLFLLTKQRICWYCLHENQAYWLVPLSKAKRLFGLKERDLRGIPVLRSLHGAKFIPPVRLGMRERLIAGRDAKLAGVHVHGSPAALAQYVRGAAYALGDKYLGMWLANAPLHALPRNPSQLPQRRNRPEACARYEGMGNILFPTLLRHSQPHRPSHSTPHPRPLALPPSPQLEAGYWCLGCQARLNDTTLPPAWLHGLARRARSRSAFAAHLPLCKGVRRFLGAEAELVLRAWRLVLEGACAGAGAGDGDDEEQERMRGDVVGEGEELEFGGGDKISGSLYGEFDVGEAGQPVSVEATTSPDENSMTT